MGKLYDIVAVVGEYTNANGEVKKRYENVGAVLDGRDGGQTILLKKTFNPAGLAQPDRESIILSCFEPKDSGSRPARNEPQQRQRPASRPQTQNAPEFDDELPF